MADCGCRVKVVGYGQGFSDEYEIVQCPLHANTEKLRKALVEAAIPYEAILLDAESRKWIAPEVWKAIEDAVVAARAALAELRAAGKNGGVE